MNTYVISNLHLGSGKNSFKFENIEFKKLDSQIPVEKQWCEKYGATFKAIADNSIKPILSSDATIGAINDLCLLLSIAQSRSIFCCRYEIDTNGHERVSENRCKIYDPELIVDLNLEHYLVKAVETLRQTKWGEKTGFIPSAYFWAETLNHESGDIGFLLTWIALEVLANANALKSHSKSKSKKICISQKISEMVRDNDWNFFQEDLISRSKKVRDKIMHEGNYGRIDRKTMPSLFSEFLKAIQLALINLLGCSEYVHNTKGNL